MQTGYSSYWDGIKSELSEKLLENEIYMWIDRLNFHDFDSQQKILYLSAPSNFVKDNIKKNYLSTMINILKSISGINDISIEIKLIANNGETPPLAQTNTEHEEKKITKPQEKTSSHIYEEPEKPTISIEHDTQKNNIPSTEQKTIQPAHNDSHSNEVDEKFTFDSFVIASSNQFAAEICKEVAINPGISYNPVFIWGESGLGKTHLMKSIYNSYKDNLPHLSVRYVTAEEFVNDFVQSMHVKKNTFEFKDTYRSLDALIIDDIQFFYNKDNTQQELFNTFETLYDKRKQMVFSADQPLSKLRSIEERLKTRFNMGTTVQLEPASYELKMAILLNLAISYDLKFDQDAANYICVNLQGNIRELKGAFNNIRAYSNIMHIQHITYDIVAKQLEGKIMNTMFQTYISVDKIIPVVGEYFDITTNEITGLKRTKSIALARQIAMYLSKKHTQLSNSQIGSYFGNREHGTVMHATKKITNMMNNDSTINSAIINLNNRLKNL